MGKEAANSFSKQMSPFAEYWKIYGGARELLRSVYLHVSVVVTGLSFPIWRHEGWWDMAFALLPSMIGFLIGTFGLLLAFGGDYFKSLMARATGKSIYSALDTAAANFCHFLVVQFSALLAALLSKSLWLLTSSDAECLRWHSLTYALWGFGFLLLVYSMACGLASVMAIFRIAREITIVENVTRMAVDAPPKAIGRQESHPE